MFLLMNELWLNREPVRCSFLSCKVLDYMAALPLKLLRASMFCDFTRLLNLDKQCSRVPHQILLSSHYVVSSCSFPERIL
jgi:hypothetical protein